MAAARFRKTFRYPEDTDSDEPAEGIDEEEQDKLIDRLRSQNEMQNARFTNVFTVFSLVPIPWYLAAPFRSSSSKDLLIGFLGIQSLIITAYIMFYVRPEKPDVKGKRPVYLAEQQHTRGPMQKYLPWLNVCLSVALCIIGITISLKKSSGRSETDGLLQWKCYLPSSE
ncbi:MAG: hypothetical protein M1820_006532 [Bogoriella megaspora]|nr:MAG: hypothetical protein M1820_006532 [Bogoriella megaspora]